MATSRAFENRRYESENAVYGVGSMVGSHNNYTDEELDAMEEEEERKREEERSNLNSIAVAGAAAFMRLKR